jgi:uncharacterized protein YbaR (Trm112 family)
MSRKIRCVWEPESGHRRRQHPRRAARAPTEPVVVGQGRSRSGLRPHTPWAELLRRVFQIDVLACPECGGRLRLLATIEDPAVVKKILSHLGISHEWPSPAPRTTAAGGNSTSGVIESGGAKRVRGRRCELFLTSALRHVRRPGCQRPVRACGRAAEWSDTQDCGVGLTS